MNRLIYIVPVLVFVVLAAFLFFGCREPRARRIAFHADRQAGAHADCPRSMRKAQAFAPADLRSGHVTVVNVFASWCAPCREEAPALVQLSQIKGVALYGMVQKDTPQKARAFLAEVGNPFRASIWTPMAEPASNGASMACRRLS